MLLSLLTFSICLLWLAACVYIVDCYCLEIGQDAYSFCQTTSIKKELKALWRRKSCGLITFTARTSFEEMMKFFNIDPKDTQALEKFVAKMPGYLKYMRAHPEIYPKSQQNTFAKNCIFVINWLHFLRNGPEKPKKPKSRLSWRSILGVAACEKNLKTI